MKNIVRVAVALWALAACDIAIAESATVSWIEPTQNTDGTPLTDLSSYEIHSGCVSSGVYDRVEVVQAPALTYTVDNLFGDTCYFAAKSTNTQGVSSVFSNETSKVFAQLEVPGPVLDTAITWRESRMTIAIVQGGSGNALDQETGGDAVATIDFTVANSLAQVTAGNSLLFHIKWRTSGDATAITSITIEDESNATLSVVRAPIHATGLNGASHAWAYLSNVTTTGDKLITLTMNGSPTTGRFTAWELSGADTSGMLGATESTEGDSTQVIGSLETTAANSAIFAAYGNDGGGQTVQSGWTDIPFANLSWFSDGAYKLDNGSAGVKSIDPASTNTPGDWGLTAVEVLIAPTGGATVVLTGTAISGGVLESEIVTGGETVIITLTDDTWVAAGAGPIGSVADTQALIDGFDAASSPTNGWNNEVRDKAATSEIVRTSNTVATWTIAAQSGYDISADETITATIPAAVLVTSGDAVEADDTFDITNEGKSKLVVLHRHRGV